jgi:hypothetical protein
VRCVAEENRQQFTFSLKGLFMAYNEKFKRGLHLILVVVFVFAINACQYKKNKP